MEMAFTSKSFKVVLKLLHDSCTKKYIQSSTVYVDNSCKPADFHLWIAEDCFPTDGTAENVCQAMKMLTEDLTVYSQLDAGYLVGNSFNSVSTTNDVNLRSSSHTTIFKT